MAQRAQAGKCWQMSCCPCPVFVISYSYQVIIRYLFSISGIDVLLHVFIEAEVLVSVMIKAPGQSPC